VMAPAESGCMVIPKSLSHARIAENLRSSEFRLTETEMDEIACLDEGRRVNADIEAIV
jgi:2,5-diketo-D-gluconate reductase A